ncbi:unnamed protein product [Parajaminaea phylloscopi]
MSDWDAVTKIGRSVRPSGGGGGGAPGVPTAYDRARAAGAINDQDRKTTAGRNAGHTGTDHAKLAKLDRDNEVHAPTKVAPSVGKAIAQGRQAKGMTQKDLGTAINEKPTVIQDYEGGKAVPNPQVLGKLERALGVKLRGKDIGAPLGGPSKKK